MFDTLKVLWAAFSGGVAAFPKTRKSVWVLLFMAVFGLACTVYAAWLGLPGYTNLIHAAGGGVMIGGGFAFLVAAVVKFTGDYVAGYLAENSSRNGIQKSYERSIMLICMLVFSGLVYFDFRMNMHGSEVRADDFAGFQGRAAYQTPPERAAQIERLQGIQNEIMKSRDKNNWLPVQSRRALENAAKEMRAITSADSLDRARFNADADRLESDRQTRRENIAGKFKATAWLVFIAMFLAGLGAAFTVESMQKEIAGNPEKHAEIFGFPPGGTWTGHGTDTESLGFPVGNPMIYPTAQTSNDGPGIGYRQETGRKMNRQGIEMQRKAAQNRAAIVQAIQAMPQGWTVPQLHQHLSAQGFEISQKTIQRHVKSLNINDLR